MREIVVNLILKYPKRLLILSLLVIFAFAPGLLKLKSDYSYRAWYSEDDPLLVQFDEFERTFGNDDTINISIEADNIYTKETLEIIYDLTEKLWAVPGIVRVDSLANFSHVSSTDDEIDTAPLISEEERENINPGFIEDLKQKVKGEKLVEGFYVSENEKMAIVRAQVRPSLKARLDNKEIVLNSRALAQEYRDKYPQYKFHVAGTATFVYIFQEITESDLALLIPLLCVFFGLVLIFIYRNKSGLILPFVIIICSIMLMLSMSGYLNHSITTISAAAPSILFTIAVADAIHIMTVYFFGLKQGFSNTNAARYSLTKNFYPTFLTSLTTAIGFFSFSNSLIKSIADLGVEVGFGVIFAWLVSYFILGPLLVLRGSVSKNQTAKIVDEAAIETAEKNFVVKPHTTKYVQMLFKFKVPILVAAVTTAVFAFVSATNLVINLDPNTQFKEDHPYKVAVKDMRQNFGSLHEIKFMINAGKEDAVKEPTFLNRMEAFDTWLNQKEYVLKTISILDIIKNINQTLNANNPQYYTIPQTKAAVGQNLFFYMLGLPQGRELTDKMSLKADNVKLTAVWDIGTSKEANEKIEEFEAKAKEFGLNAKVTGKLPLFHQLTPYVVSSFLESFAIALMAITIILIIVLKSFKLGFLALIPNLLPLLVGGGLYALSGQYVDIASVIIVAVCLGIAVDDSIHFLFEFQKFRKKGYPLAQTFEMIFTNTAPSLFNTTILIVIGFGSFIVADYLPNAKFGMMVSLILMVALIADFIVLPAVLIMAEGKTNERKT